MSIIDNVFRPIYRKPCWQVEQGYGSFLTFEFGEPHLDIQEPRQIRQDASEGAKKYAARRHVYVHGDWHLWVYLCDWRILSHGQVIAHSGASRRVIKKATWELNGQALVQVNVSDGLVSTMDFDLGGQLVLIPNTDVYEKTAELWRLFEPSGDVFTLRADKQYCRAPGSTAMGDEPWQALG